MNSTVEEWIAKAEGDLAVAMREMRARRSRNLDAVCFHAQQCAEKLLKALLTQRGVVPPRSHDLLLLSQSASVVCPEWSWPAEDLRFLTRAAVSFRYPGESADLEEARTALAHAKRMREGLLSILEERR